MNFFGMYESNPYLLLSTSIFGLATRNTLGTMPASVVNSSSDISCGSSNCRVLEYQNV